MPDEDTNEDHDDENEDNNNNYGNDNEDGSVGLDYTAAEAV